MQPCTPRLPTSVERQRLVETYAKLKYAAIARAPLKARVKLHKSYRKALTVVLDRLCVFNLSPENIRGLDMAASKWWTGRTLRGPGKDW